MKRSRFIVVLFFISCTGCSIGQNWGCSRPNIFSRMYNCIHGNNVGAPCASGACTTGAYAGAPMASGPMVASEGCTDCGGSSTAGYESYEGTGVQLNNSYVPQSNIYSSENVVPVPARQ